MYVETASERGSVIDTVWLRAQERDEMIQYVASIIVSYRVVNSHIAGYRSGLPLSLPWSQGFYLCCQDVSPPS
jgi:exocyst complex component 6